MIRQALKTKRGTARGKIMSSVTRPAPTLGWNTRDSVANMKPGYAIRLLNWFPTPNDCVVRGGNEQHATGFDSGAGAVETLAVYNAMNGTSKLFGATDTGIYDATSAGAVGATVLARTEARHQCTNFGDGTTNWLIMVNGTDKPAYYSGSAWTAVDGATTPALTGITTTKLIHVCVHKGRLFFIEKDSLSYWYLAAGAAGGALTEFDLSSILSRGGYLMWMATWTRDGGLGPDDYAVFMSSEGQVAVYAGNNPSSASAWTLVGIYDIGRPLGRRSYVEMNGDLIIMTENGIFPMSVALQAEGQDKRTAITDIIDKAFNSAALLYGDQFGWEAVIHPRQSALVCNIPQASDTRAQYVMNTITKAWCQFDSWNANCFAVMGGELYFGMTGEVRKAWSGMSDNGSDIIADGKTSFDYLGGGAVNKRFGMYRPILLVDGSFSFLTDIDVDFSDDDIVGTATYSAPAEALWDDAEWDDAVWGGGLTVVRQWTSPSENIGFCVAGKIRVATNSLEVHWIANDYTYEGGGTL